jgi:hypothetical protein
MHPQLSHCGNPQSILSSNLHHACMWDETGIFNQIHNASISLQLNKSSYNHLFQLYFLMIFLNSTFVLSSLNIEYVQLEGLSGVTGS